ncbi:MAG: PAS domain S-box protein [Opitutales bacterium]|nr:PAS domain S-box protein [Opitutales bacterium]
MSAPAHILLVDDNTKAREVTARILRKAGHKVEEATAGEEALRCVNTNPPLLILLDIVLPGLSGYEVLHRLRANPTTQNIPVVFLSSQKISPEDHAEGLDLGAEDYITRPIANTELLARVRLHLRQIELTVRLRANEAHFRELINNQADGVLVIDQEGTIQFTNPAADRLFGKSPDSLVGQPFGFPLHSTKVHEIEIQRPDGEEIVAEIRVSNAEWSGKPAWVATLNDITERIRTEEERNALFKQLEDRVKELLLYHTAAEMLKEDEAPLNQIISEIVRLIPPAMRLPGSVEAKIVLAEIDEATPCYRESEERFTVEFALRGEQTGRIEVAYVGDLPEGDEGAFLDEERNILQTLAEMLRAYYDRRWMQTERARNQALLSIAGRVARIGGWTIELPDRKLTQSDEVRAIHELPPGKQLTIQEAIKFYPQEYRSEVTKLLQRCIDKGHPFQFEMELITAKDRRIPVLAIGQAVRNEANEIIRVQGAFQDLSEVKAAEASMEASERRFRQLAESMPMIVWTADAKGNIDYANQRLFEFTGAQPHEDPHTRWQRFVHPEDLTPALEKWARCVREEIPYEITYRMVHRQDDQYHWFRVQAQPVRDSDGVVSRWFGTGIDIHKTKSLEEKARKLAEHLTRTFESMTDGFFTLDQEWRFTYINRELEQFLGRDREDLLGKILWDELPEILGTPTEKACLKAMRDNVTMRFEDYYAPLERWLNLRVYPSADGLSIFTQDITQRKQDEEQMRLLAASITSINDIVMITKADPIDEPGPEIVFVNEAFERLTGYPAKEVIGRSPRILQGPKSDRVALARIRKALTSGYPICEEVINYDKDGREYLLEINLHPVRDDSGKINHFVAVERDVTEERATKKTLRESEERFRTLLRDVPTIAIQGYDLEGNVLYWNKASEALYGYTEKEALQSNLFDLIIPPETHEEMRAALKDIEEGAENIPTSELSLIRKDGSRVDVLSSHAILRRPGRAVELFCIDIDLTDRKMLEAQILRAQRLESIGTLAGGIAHDLNNMLSPVIMGVSLMRQLDEAEKLHPIIDDILRSAEHGRDLVKQVLAFARGADGGERITLDITQLIKDIEAIVKNTFPKSIRFEKEIPKNLWKIPADPTQLSQVLLNLCVNARDAMPEGGCLRIAVENLTITKRYATMFSETRPGRYLVIEVSDEGCGMDEATKDRVFEPFFTTKKFGEGTGLGLSTVMGIVRGHGGFVNVYSEPGTGARFNVYLPAHTNKDSSMKKALDDSEEALPNGNGECILIADDEVSIRSMSKLTLEAYGYKVIVAENGTEATNVFEAHRNEIDLLLSDIMMPEMDGVTLIRTVKKIAPNFPVIAMSGLRANGNKIHAEESGVTDFLSKPFTADTLLRLIHKVLDHQ